jgi:hypothetical protein
MPADGILEISINNPIMRTGGTWLLSCTRYLYARIHDHFDMGC